jgi:hypothetical protein
VLTGVYQPSRGSSERAIAAHSRLTISIDPAAFEIVA